MELLGIKDGVVRLRLHANGHGCGSTPEVVADEKAHGIGPIPLSGQDATPQGLQYIISGWQTMTVWKDTRKLAKAAATEAVALLNRGARSCVRC